MSTKEGKMSQPLHEIFLDELADIYDAEKQLTKALPKMAKAAKSDDLREAFELHLEETREHANRVERIFALLDEKAKSKPCKAMQGLIAEGEQCIEEHKDSEAFDAALIAAAQKVEHYEIAGYGSLCAWARQMGHDEIVDILEETLDEEKEADEKLTDIAENSANKTA